MIGRTAHRDTLCTQPCVLFDLSRDYCVGNAARRLMIAGLSQLLSLRPPLLLLINDKRTCKLITYICH